MRLAGMFQMYVNVVGVCWQQKHTDVCEDGTINLLLVSNGAVITGGRVVGRTLGITTDRKKTFPGRSCNRSAGQVASVSVSAETNSSLSIQQDRHTGSDETHKAAANRPQGQSMLHYGKLQPDSRAIDSCCVWGETSKRTALLCTRTQHQL